MKFSATLLAPLLAPGALAFVLPSAHQSTVTTATELQAMKLSTATYVAASVILGIGLSAQATFANANDMPTTLAQQPQYYSTAVASSSTVVAEIEKFTLPSYDSSKGSVLIDISSDLETVNKKTMSLAKERREKTDTSAEKLQADELRRAEKDGSSLLDSLLGESEMDRKARIEAEKAEARANRWKTF